MGKQGPCHHCGVTSTPLWRNGPPEKPVLCNACGSRWRTKGTLAKYRPLHARTEPDEFEDYRVQRVRTIPIKNKEARLLKRKKNHDIEIAEMVDPDHCFKNGNGDTSDYNHVYRKDLNEDPSNKSSSGSAISNSDSCVQLRSAGASYLTGPCQSIVWDGTVPSRKRTCVGRPKTSSVEKLTKVLLTILHEQQFYLFGSSEDALLFESDTPMVSVEIGHGSVLIRHPSSIAHEEESEVSSLSVDKKHNSANEAYSPLATLPVHDFNKHINVSCLGNERINEPVKKMEQDQCGRERTQQEKLHILGNHNSQICSIDLKLIVNFEVFEGHLTNDEQQQLMKYLPSVDTVELPDSLLSMLDSPQFNEDLCAFQKLLAEGVFDLSSSGDKSECNRTLKRLAVSNLKTSCWVEQYSMQKDINCKSTTGGALDAGEQDAVSSALSVKRSDDGKYKNLPDHICLKGQALQGLNSRSFSVAKRARAKTTTKITKRKVMTNYEQKELEGNHANCFSPTSLYGLPPDSTSLMLGSFQCAAESFDQDLLLNVPFHTSFPQAELLPTSSFGAQASTDNSSIHENA